MVVNTVSSEEWLKRLTEKLVSRRHVLAKFDAYYRGDQGTRLVNPAKYPPQFVKVFERYCENFMAVVVDAVEERLDIEGFRFPQTHSGSMTVPPVCPTCGHSLGCDCTLCSCADPVHASMTMASSMQMGTAPIIDTDATDTDAWRIWQDNELDATSQIGHTEALVKSIAYVLVSPFDDDRIGTSPRITVETPDEVIVQLEPGTRRRIVGMKQWDDLDAKRTYATLYYPDRVEKWEAIRDATSLALPAPVSTTPLPADDPFHTGGGGTEKPLDAGSFTGATSWQHRIVEGESWPLPHSLGVVPIVPIINRPRLDGTGESELSKVMTLQDAINTLAMNELVTSESAAIPQKWASGIEIPKDPETGKDLEPFRPDTDRIISTPVPDAKFGVFEAADLGQFGDAIDRRVKRIASITRTPYHYFLDHGGQPPSGESLKSSETGLVRKAQRKTRHFGERWEEVMRLAFLVQGDPRGKVTDAETVWANPESLTESEHIDALTKSRASLKIPLEQLWEDANYTPAQRARFWSMLRAEAANLAGTLVEPVAPGDGAQEQVQERVSP